MSLANYGQGPGKWQFHHIIPIKSFDLTNEEEFKKAANYLNIQPIWFEDHHSIHEQLSKIESKLDQKVLEFPNSENIKLSLKPDGIMVYDTSY